MKQKTKDTRFSATARPSRRLALASLASLASLAACAVMLLGACSEENALNGSGDGAQTPVNLVARIQQAAALPAASSAGGTDTPHTRTAIGADGNTTWTAGDAVGVFMRAPKIFNPSGILPGGENVGYTVDPATGRLTPVGTPILYPRDEEEEVDFFAYYPLGTKGDGKITDDYVYTLSVTDQSDPVSLDLLVANAIGKKKSKEAVEFTFEHALAKIQLDITLGEGLRGLDPGKITAVTITGMPTTAEYELLSIPGVTKASDPADIVTRREPTPSENTAATFTALLIPHEAPATMGIFTERRIVVTVDGTDYSGDISNNDKIWYNRLHIYPVTVQRTGVTLGTPEIAEWTTNDHGTGTATEIGAGIEKVRIPAGTFLMGSPDGISEAVIHEKPQHEVTLTRDFLMSKYEITAAQYADFLNAAGVAKAEVDSRARHTVDGYGEQDLFEVNPWIRTPQWNDATDRWEAGGNTPMINVTWFGAKAYADWVGGSLPTEAQWEYACRAGTTTAYSFGDDAAGLGDYAWYQGNSGSINGPSPVGTKKPNPWGLYDMHGNVPEWCSDRYGSDYYSDPSAGTDPTGPASGDYRVVRGGGWTYSSRSCRSACRISGTPGSADYDLGFRVVFND
ncbi:SUMF1/EgtB/PvdO family nonheme iron enzyme [Bacteroides thetaiotaomicron]|uniref:SUMF1/EgtB/PvdO family nonheme iron enzyme n=1 Tax=Bacteroides thetaiotaomicron TaxID=818 RepID=UPI003563E0B8